MNLFPQVKKITYHEGQFDINQGLFLTKKAFNTYKKELNMVPIISQEPSNLKFMTNAQLPPEAYHLTITKDQIIIESSTKIGELWGIKTLKQILKQNTSSIPCLKIEDEPVLSMRGFMLDISRNKIPNIKTIFQYIDLLSDLKMNHFELYIEGFSYFYPSFSHAYDSNMEPLNEVDFKKIEAYSKKKGIDFVLCHNTFGHMNAWLAIDQYRDLAIMKDGMMMWGWMQSASTLNPLKKESIDFVLKLIDDAVKGSDAPYFNICFDEAYELGHGPTEKTCQTRGISKVFIDYLNIIVNHLRTYGKKTLMWGDFFVHHKEALNELDQDVIVIDWGYDRNYPFNETLKVLSDKHIPFISAPGTSSWNSITGRTIDMLENVQKAIEYTKKYNGLGTLLTDWGDNGHLQYPIISYPAIVYTALESWSNHTGNQSLIRDYLNIYVYNDTSKQLGDLNLDLGRYQRYQKSYTHNGTELMSILGAISYASNQENPWDAFLHATKHFDYSLDTLNRMKREYEDMKKVILSLKKSTIDKVYLREFLGSIHHVLLPIDLLIAARTNKHLIPSYAKKLYLEHEKTWLMKNRAPGLSYSSNLLKSVMAFQQK